MTYDEIRKDMLLDKEILKTRKGSVAETLTETLEGLEELHEDTWGKQYLTIFEEEELECYLIDLKRLKSIRDAIKLLKEEE